MARAEVLLTPAAPGYEWLFGEAEWDPALSEAAPHADQIQFERIPAP